MSWKASSEHEAPACARDFGRCSGHAPALFRALSSAKRIASITGGLIDPTLGPLTRLWRESRRTRELPDPVAVQMACGATGHQKLLLDPATRSATLQVPGMQLDLGAFAKGATTTPAWPR